MVRVGVRWCRTGIRVRHETGEVDCRKPEGDDDEFDAAVGYLLGVLYLRGLDEARPCITLLGSRETGAFLVPNVDGLRESWDEFVKKWPEARIR